jgi:hypothetical protein
MTTCTPLKPFRCWQYRNDSPEPIPEWVMKCLSRLTPKNHGFWVVEFVDSGEWCWYTPVQFIERFKVLE